jgi:hypothetical protein
MEEKQNLSKIVNCSHLIVFEILHICEIKKYTRFLEEIHHKTSHDKNMHLVYSVVLRTSM